MAYFIAGVVVGTFIPGPQQEWVRFVFRSIWGRIKGLATRSN